MGGRKPLLALTIWLLLSGVAQATPENWRTCFDPKGRFTIQLPNDSVSLNLRDAGVGARIFIPDRPLDSAGLLVMAIPIDPSMTLDDCFREVKNALGKSVDSKIYSEYRLVSDGDTSLSDHPTKVLTANYRYKTKDPNRPNPLQIQIHYSLIDDKNLYTIVCTSEFDQYSRYEEIFKEAIESIHYMRKPPVVAGEDGPG